MAIKRQRNDRAFTLVEICIACAVFSMFCVLAWTLLSGWMSSSVTSIWRQTSMKELSTMAQRLRQDLQKASYPAMVTPEDTTVGNNNNYFISIFGAAWDDDHYSGGDWEGDTWDGMDVRCFGPGKTGQANADPENILQIYQCTPGRERVPQLGDADAVVTRITYYLANGQPVYGRSGKKAEFVQDLWVLTERTTISNAAEIPNAPSGFSEVRRRQLVQGVNTILIGVDKSDGWSGNETDPDHYAALKIKVLSVEVAEGKAYRSITVTAAGQTGVKQI